ncbi:ABC transporter ATP-binding protein [Priestia taiwanensis]|uniref:ABC transporter ATP-binding protein n=1 Tax=Priestia taiwanensis TaxID=1347902 RepID=A0A917AXF7_9BACI|nr:ABC transporter ATP-binding protein [Priestia taiwanensis]MBM7363340.1 NitT/TauT family transport system ATP-binding protein [Priestia taiwanensis]GGE77943.1 ABC transporter ATP-binding protein [Priestia taiwanensis]
MSFVTLQHVSHAFFNKKELTEVLEDITLSVEDGEFVSFIGPSGCGKTTLLSLISGLLTPLEGEIHFTTNTKNIGYMLQQDYLFPWKTIEQNILLGLKVTKTLDEDTKKKALTLLEKVGLAHVQHAYPRQLSGGMRQRVALVRTLATNPGLLLLDEPFSALDYQNKLKLEDLVSVLLKQYNKTSILVTHDIEEAIAMSHRIFLFGGKPGKLIQTFIVPTDIQQLTPFEARRHPTFSLLFEEIWKEMEQLERT